MQYKFLMETVADEIRQNFADVIGRQYFPDILVSFSYWTMENEDRSCFSMVNGMHTETYTANMMVADGDERDCLCAYSPYRSRLTKIAKRGYAIFNTNNPMGRNTLKANQLRSPEHCPGCKLTIRNMKVSVIIHVFQRTGDILSNKQEIIAFIKKMKKDVEKNYEIRLKEVKIVLDRKDFRT